MRIYSNNRSYFSPSHHRKNPYDVHKNKVAITKDPFLGGMGLRLAGDRSLSKKLQTARRRRSRLEIARARDRMKKLQEQKKLEASIPQKKVVMPKIKEEPNQGGDGLSSNRSEKLRENLKKFLTQNLEPKAKKRIQKIQPPTKKLEKELMKIVNKKRRKRTKGKL
jgi:hypothetical protein